MSLAWYNYSWFANGFIIRLLRNGFGWCIRLEEMWDGLFQSHTFYIKYQKGSNIFYQPRRKRRWLKKCRKRRHQAGRFLRVSVEGNFLFTLRPYFFLGLLRVSSSSSWVMDSSQSSNFQRACPWLKSCPNITIELISIINNKLTDLNSSLKTSRFW